MSHRPKYVSYDRLLSNGRAVYKQRNFVYYSTAGKDPQVGRLAHPTGRAAKATVILFFGELRKARSDEEYNRILAKLLAEIRDAWPVNTRTLHVHQCDRGNSGQDCRPNAVGVTPCGFDWTKHEQTEDCKCVIEIDSTDASGKVRFVVHRNFKSEGTIYV